MSPVARRSPGKKQLLVLSPFLLCFGTCLQSAHRRQTQGTGHKRTRSFRPPEKPLSTRSNSPAPCSRLQTPMQPPRSPALHGHSNLEATTTCFMSRLVMNFLADVTIWQK